VFAVALPPSPVVTAALQQIPYERAIRKRLGIHPQEIGPIEMAFEQLHAFVVGAALGVTARGVSGLVDQILLTETYPLLVQELRMRLAREAVLSDEEKLSFRSSQVWLRALSESCGVWSILASRESCSARAVERARGLDHRFRLLASAESMLLTQRSEKDPKGGEGDAFLSKTISFHDVIDLVRQGSACEVPFEVVGASVSLVAIDVYALLAHASITGPIPASLFSSTSWTLRQHADAALGLLQTFAGVSLPRSLHPPPRLDLAMAFAEREEMADVIAAIEAPILIPTSEATPAQVQRARCDGGGLTRPAPRRFAVGAGPRGSRSAPRR